MCLILFAKNAHPQFKFVLAANRDEFFNRPAMPADFFDDHPDILAGRDIISGGTWLGINLSGRFIAITNFRDPKHSKPTAVSRGELSFKFLSENMPLSHFLEEVKKKKDLFNGFNLLLSDNGFDTLFHYSNISNEITQIDSGIHGVSNHLLNTPWPKIETGKGELTKIMASKSIQTPSLIELLRDSREAPDNSLPNTGISFDIEKKLSPVFISMNDYGTRCSTAVLLDNNMQLRFHEVTYNEKRQIEVEKNYKIKLKQSFR